MKFAALAVLALAGNAAAGEFSPKYAPEEKPLAVALKRAPAHIRSAPAPDFWALMPYYEGMRGPHSASAASAAMVLNALRQGFRYSSADELITEEALLRATAERGWADRLAGEKPAGVDLAAFGALFESSLSTYGVSASVRTIPVAGSDAAAVASVRRILADNERFDGDFLIALYKQSVFTGDPEGAVGVYAPVGAFDAARDAVLIFETDRKWYEPYWVSLDTFVQALASLRDAEGRPAGGLTEIRAKEIPPAPSKRRP
ncbi:MAG: phytochelatin synthase family protein [Elusimicrobiota bacterium]|nr:phytochelatin synthase family protein [Elusimicrobiota bacterium]